MRQITFLFLTTLLVSCTQQETSNLQQKISENYNYKTYTNIDEAKQYAKQVDRPILIMFTCLGCLPYSDLAWEVLQNKEAKNLIDNNYIFATLYVDDRTPIKHINSAETNKKEKITETVGNKNISFQIKHFNNIITQPYYAIVDTNFNKLTTPISYIRKEEVDTFIKFLQQGIKNYEQ